MLAEIRCERLLDVLFTHTPDCVALLAPNYDFVRVNEGYARATGRPAAYFPGRNHFELYPSDAKNLFDSVVASKRPFQTFARPFRYPDQPDRGTTYWDWTLAPVLDDAGEVELLVFTLREVTRQKRAELAVAQHRNQLRGSLAAREHELELLQAELLAKERLAALGQLLAIVGHELRNPLGVIQASIELLATRLADVGHELGVAAPMGRAERSVRRCHGVIEELLDYTREHELEAQPTDLDGWLGQILAARELPEDLVCELVLGVERSVSFDRTCLQRCVDKVVDNAIDAMREGHRARQLCIETRHRDGRVEIRITDTGPGVPEHRLGLVFEPLYSTKIYGVGLGLPMVRRLMRLHGGDVEIDSAVGEGSTVTLWLPCRVFDAHDPDHR